MDEFKIIPAVLAHNSNELRHQLSILTPLANEIYIDYADGQLVNGKTVNFQELLDIPRSYLENKFSLHIMAQSPFVIANEACDAGYTIITIQLEAIDENELDMISELAMRAKVFLAIKPETGIEKLEPFLDCINGVTIMTIDPGAQGRGFQGKALDKITSINALGFDGEIEVDGSINQHTITQAINAGAQRFVIGSALTKTKDPIKAYKQLLEKINNG